MTTSFDSRESEVPSGSLARRGMSMIWHEARNLLLAAGVSVLILVLAVLAVVGVPILGFAIYARLNTSTVEWPHPDAAALRERTELQFPLPPASSFETATITTYFDGDKWKCVRYRTEATAADTRSHYTKLLREMKYGISDGYGYDGPYTWQLSVIAMDGTVRLTPWDDTVPAEGAPPPYRVAICFIYEPWTYPKVEKPPIPTTTIFWPHPEVAAWRAEVEQAFPPDPAWSFKSATMITRPDGYKWDCVTYETGLPAEDGRTYYRQWLPRAAHLRSDGPPYLVNGRILATDGTVTICPYFK